MIKTFVAFFKSVDIRKKIFFTLGFLFVYMFGKSIIVPGIDTTVLHASLSGNSLVGMLNMLGGGSLTSFSIFSMGVGPYITSSIIIQLLSMDVIPYLTDLAKEGQTGRQKMDRITRYLGVVLCFVQAFSMTYAFDKAYGLVTNPSIFTYLYVSTILTAGTMFLLWIGDQITLHGVGNGVSIIIFAGIVSTLPFDIYNMYMTMASQGLGAQLQFWLYIVLYLVIIVIVVVMQLAVRKIPIQYSAGNGHRGGKDDMNHLPLKINSASVIPVIFAQSIITAPQIIATFLQGNSVLTTIGEFLSPTNPIGLVIYGILIVLFTFFYTDLQVNPEKIAENLQKSNAYILLVRPGADTKRYISTILNRITVLGMLALLVVAILPYLLPMITSLPSSSLMSIGGTGVIIAVGVAMDTTSQLKGQLTQKNYRGFFK